jgi:DNA-binding GntR family transcriptional regulator
MLGPVEARRESVTDQVFEAIRTAIVNRELPPGHRLSEAKLAAELRVSKTPVRETLIRLQHVGLVEADPVRGLRVVQPSARVVKDAYEIRSGLESLAAALAAEKADDKMRRQIREAADSGLACTLASDYAGRRHSDRTFHDLIARGSGNDKLAVAIDDYYALTWALRQRDVPEIAENEECARQHQRIAAAIERADSETARSAMTEHLNTLRERVLAALSARPRPW